MVVSRDIETPRHWYNILCETPFKLPEEKKSPKAVSAAIKLNIPKTLVKQNMPLQTWVPIPEPVREAYSLWRPTVLRRAVNLERYLDTPARIYYKYEGDNLSATHKLSTALPQTYYYKEAGASHLVSCTAAGQWGTAIAQAMQYFGISGRLYMVGSSYKNKVSRRTLMQLLGVDVVMSPSNQTAAGRKELEDNPLSEGSLSLAMTEAIEDAAMDQRRRWILGGSESFAILHTTVLGTEAEAQLNCVGEDPDIIIGYIGGGKSFGGLVFPFIHKQINDGKPRRYIAVESSVYPVMTKGRYCYDYTDYTGITPLAKMYTLGSSFARRHIQAEGMKYHACSKLISALYNCKMIEARAYPESVVFKAAVDFIRAEGVLPSPESSYAVKACIDEALIAKEKKQSPVILFALTDRGDYDMDAYGQYLAGKTNDVSVSEDEIAQSLQHLPDV